LIILDERAYAEQLLKTKKFGNYIKLKDMVLLSKYYYYLGFKTREIKKKLKELCKRVDPNWNDITQSWKLTVSIRESKKRKLRLPMPIPITRDELYKIKQINDYSLEKVLFIFLAISKILKYNTTVIKPRRSARLIGLFYSNEKASNVFSLAKVDVRKKQRSEMLHYLYEMEYLDATRWNGFLIKYVCEDSPVEFMIEDYENLVLYYQRYCGEQVENCSECGKLFLKRNSRLNLCHNCKQEKRREQWRQQKTKGKIPQ
jgi:hypothetical protein